MKPRILISLSIICVAVVVGSVVVQTGYWADIFSKGETLGFTKLEPSLLTSISRDFRGDVHTLTHEGGTWTLDGVPIESTHVTSLVSGISHARATLVSKKGRDVSEYGLLVEAIQLSFVSGEDTYTYIIGAQGPTPGSVYVAVSDAPEVYLVERSTLGDLARTNWSSWVATTSSATSTEAMTGAE